MSDPLDPAALDQLFLTARTYNSWQEAPLDPALLRRIYETARWAPTEANSNPGRFVFVTSREGRDALASFATGQNPPKIRLAPCTVIIGHDLDYHSQMGRFFPAAPGIGDYLASHPQLHDKALRGSSMQGAYLIVAARALGLDCGPMAGFDNAKVDAHFFAGTNIRSNFICSLGHGTPDALYPRGERFTFDEACRFA
jgi:3-hydroxypropanoate dehydrogenase